MKKSVLFVVDNLKMGGVTKVLANLLNKLDYSKYDVELLVLHYYEDMKINYPETVNLLIAGTELSLVDESITKLLKEKNVVKIMKKMLFAFSIKTGFIKKKILKDRNRTLKKQYDIEIAFGDGFPYIYTSFGDSKRKIAWMHSDVLIKDYSARYFKKMKIATNSMDVCIAVSDKVAESYEKKYGVQNIRVIQNVIDDEEILLKSNMKKDVEFDDKQLNFISVGRLDYSKNYEMLFNVAKKLRDEEFKFKIYLIGEGSEREKLEKLVKENSMESVFILCGRKENPYPYVKSADMFLLSSRYEGLPTVVIEALILHVPCLATDVAGIRQILNNKGGIVTRNDETDFYLKMKELLLNEKKIISVKKELDNYKYDNELIINNINELFDKI